VKGLIVTYLLVLAGSLGSLANPLWGLSVYTVFSIVRPHVFFGWAGSVENVSLIVGIAMLVGWAMNGFGQWQFGRAKGTVYTLAGYFLWVFLSFLFASDHAVAWMAVVERAKIVFPFLVGITMFDSEAWVRRYAWVIVLASGYVALEMNYAYVVEGYNRARDEGLLGDNNSFAIAMVAVVGPSIFLGFSTSSWWKRALAFGCALLCMHTVMLTFSRGGLVGLFVTGIAVVVLMPKRPGYVAAMVLVGLLAFRLMGPEVTERFLTTFAEEDERDVSATSRLELWRDCAIVMAQHPIFGVGPRHWPIVASDFGWPVGKEAHSLWMQTGAELGVVGLVLLVTFYTTTGWKGLRLARSGAPPSTEAHGLFVFSGLVGFVVAAQFVSLEGLEVPFFVSLVGAGALKLSGPPVTSEERLPFRGTVHLPPVRLGRVPAPDAGR